MLLPYKFPNSGGNVTNYMNVNKFTSWNIFENNKTKTNESFELGGFNTEWESINDIKLEHIGTDVTKKNEMEDLEFILVS